MKYILSALPCFSSVTAIESIGAGLSSQCYRVNADNKSFFAKKIVCIKEANINKLAAEQGLSPAVIYHDTNWLITEFIVGENLALNSLNSNAKLSIAIKLMAQCHQIKVDIPKIAPNTIANELIEKSAFSHAKKINLLHTANQLTEHLANRNINTKTKNTVCCHGDLNFSNILKDNSNKAWLIDYECACTAPAEFDLAMFVAINVIDKNEVSAIIELYQQQSAIKINHQLLACYQLFCYFINGLWYFNAGNKQNKVELDLLAKQQWTNFDLLCQLH